jgi:hypothetical protein
MLHEAQICLYQYLTDAHVLMCAAVTRCDFISVCTVIICGD